jgi:phosphonate transport system substrate-binding protein
MAGQPLGVGMTEGGRRAPLRLVTFLAPNMLPVYRFLADRIGRGLQRRVELVVGRSFDQFEQGEADLGVLCGLPYVWLAARRPPPVATVAALSTTPM